MEEQQVINPFIYCGVGGTLVSVLTGTPLLYDWVPYHYGFLKVLMVLFQSIFDGWNPTSP